MKFPSVLPLNSDPVSNYGMLKFKMADGTKDSPDLQFLRRFARDQLINILETVCIVHVCLASFAF